MSKKFAIIYYLQPVFKNQLFILAQNEEEAINTAYIEAYESESYPKNYVNIVGVWGEGEKIGGITDRFKQASRSTKYSVSIDYIKNNLHQIKKNSGQIVGRNIYL